MEAFRDGTVEALEPLFDAYAPRIERLIFRLTRDASLSKDITQTTFLSVVRGRSRYVDGGRFRPWVFTIAMNALRDHFRKSKREVLLPDSASVWGDACYVDEHRDTALGARLESALDQLPVDQRKAVLLHHVEDLSFEEIAAAVGCSRSAAKVRAHRGYLRLRELLGDGDLENL